MDDRHFFTNLKKVPVSRITTIDKTTDGYVKSGKKNFIKKRIPDQYRMILCRFYKFIGPIHLNLEVLKCH
ncbi:MAG: hypothetical protein GY775_10100 [Candidatus Scalindua sp.]|nr:hypothetical protein [Candidatus Scalindua sp.]